MNFHGIYEEIYIHFLKTDILATSSIEINCKMHLKLFLVHTYWKIPQICNLLEITLSLVSSVDFSESFLIIIVLVTANTFCYASYSKGLLSKKF